LTYSGSVLATVSPRPSSPLEFVPQVHTSLSMSITAPELDPTLISRIGLLNVFSYFGIKNSPKVDVPHTKTSPLNVKAAEN